MPRNALTDRPPTPAGDTESVWTQPRFVVAALVLALIAALGIGMALIPDGDPKAAPPATATTEVGAGAVAVPVADPAASVCGLPAGDQKVPTAAPKATRWELVGTMAAPTTPKQLGPGKLTTAGLRSCFAHTPTGALYAAVNVLAASTKPDLRLAGARELAATGVGRDAAMAALAAAAKQNASPDGGVQVAGFRVLNYDPISTLVDLALRVADTGALARMPLTMRWQAGDWKVVLAPDGQLGVGTTPISSLSGYLPWSGA